MIQLSQMKAVANKKTWEQALKAFGVAVGLGVTVLVLSLRTETEKA